MDYEGERKLAEQRSRMVEEQLVARGITDPRVLAAFGSIPRHRFVPKDLEKLAYADRALPLGPEQTISQPYIVAIMLESLGLTGQERVLEVGTGSGFQTAILCELAKEVVSIEIDAGLLKKAKDALKEFPSENLSLICGNGFAGYPERAPFDAIVIAAAANHIPRELIKQLKLGGRMVLPLADEDDPESQELILVERGEKGLKSKELGAVRFVPMKGTDA